MSQRYVYQLSLNEVRSAKSSRYGQIGRYQTSAEHSSIAPYSHQEQETSNDAAVDLLRNKVSSLRDVSIRIGEESRSSIAHMNEMNDDYSKQYDTMKRMKNNLLRAANAHSWGWFHLLLFMIIVAFIFVLVYLFH